MRRNNIKVSSIVFGLLIIGAGVLLFAFNSGVLPPVYKRIVFSWQMLLMVMGFVFLFSRAKWFAGIVLMLVGGFFLLPKLDVVGLGFVAENFWAIGLVALGIIVVCKTIWGRRFCARYADGFYTKVKWETGNRSQARENRGNDSGYIDRNNIFGGSKEKIDFTNFRGGEINSVFGGMELDLSDATLAEGVHRLEVNSVFGGLTLYLPADWNIEMQTTQVFGNFVDNRPKPAFEVDEKRKLIIEANAVFGGGEIRCREEE